ncbi:sulfotransferase 16 [Euphorbia peplus]|nr:sulfotransferase 16 [Euphorbia peplus]
MEKLSLPCVLQNDDPNKDHSKVIHKEKFQRCEKERGWISEYPLYMYEGFWYTEAVLDGLMEARESFEGRSSDILVASHMKTGTTWLKSLTFAITTRSTYPDMSSSPLLHRVSHDCMPMIETNVENVDSSYCVTRDILIATHLPYTCLPKSVVDSGCKIVYIWRDPKDVFVSLWYYINNIQKYRKGEQATIPLEEAFDLFCRGVSAYGPYWDHVLTYWKVKLEFPEKILFLKYEEMKKNIKCYVKQLADFIGYPFSIEEQDNNGAMEKIINMCSFENLSELPVNKNGSHWKDSFVTAHNKVYFRKAKVGDWVNELTPQMRARLDTITNQKFGNSGLLDQSTTC